MADVNLSIDLGDISKVVNSEIPEAFSSFEQSKNHVKRIISAYAEFNNSIEAARNDGLEVNFVILNTCNGDLIDRPRISRVIDLA